MKSLSLINFSFNDIKNNKNGSPPYNPADLLKFYIHGYLNKTRSSRGLEKEAKRNIEFI
ncbi:transposase [Tenacibaculum ovolyticum]|uniref:transposase n=1 Tax=Tenacibaculum ovolyticum TaxID=104270 RepID=UPI003A5B9A1B